MEVPSGRRLDELDMHILNRMSEVGFVRHSHAPFTLKSGIQSHVYVFGREDLTDHPDLEVLIGLKIMHQVNMASRGNDQQPCLIGIPTAGTALAQAAAMVSVVEYQRFGGAPPMCHRIMRETLKKHGAHPSWVNGDPEVGHHTYWWVDNVVTDGQSKLEAAERGRQQGYPSDMPCLIFVDRQQGALAKLEQAGFTRVTVVYNLLDITYAYGELGLWPKSAVTAVEAEIKAHQAA